MKRILSLLLSAVMLYGAGTVTAAAQTAVPPQESDEEALVIVTLSDAALMDEYQKHPDGYTDFSAFLLSSEGQQAADDIHSRQKTLRQQILAECPTADFTDSRSYCAITNGFTVSIPSSAIETIRQISGVRSVALSSVVSSHAVPSEEDTEPSEEETPEEEIPEDKKEYDTYGMASKSSIKIRSAYEAGYTGKHMLIAVIDNEFNVHHKVFSVAPEFYRCTDMIVKAIHQNIGFGIQARYKIEDIFYNGKIVYAYDYGENDNICKTEGLQHGTHVAGIAAGNNGGKGEFDFKGTAYDAQLALFKIEDQSGRLQDDAIVAALDDAVKLSPDVINCSYGAIEYLTHDYEGRQLYEKLMQSGTAVVASAGNDAYNGYAMGLDEVPVSYVHYNTVCSPSSLDGAFSVAASVPDAVYATHYSMIFNDENRAPTTMIYANISFDEIYGETMALSVGSHNDEQDGAEDEVEIDRVEYVYLNGTGQLRDFQGKDLNGKIAVVDESAIPIETLVKRSIQYHCYAVVVIKKEKNSRMKQTNDHSDFFVYTVDSAQKAYFAEHPQGTVAICSSQSMKEEPQPHAGAITEYSSFGVKADLTLKPDITAPGDNIFSSLDRQGFGVMSGTSMSSPCAAGAYCLLKQSVYDTGRGDYDSPAGLEEYLYSLMMSTADILPCHDTEQPLYYSPRLQGAGGINLDKALHTKAYLTVNDGRPKASLGDSTEGKYSFTFTVHNLSDERLTYTPSCILQTDGWKTTEDEQGHTHYIHTFMPENILSQADITFSVGRQPIEQVMVAPYSRKTFTVTIQLHEDYITQHSRLFQNGFFVDGFVCLSENESVSLHLPFTGFCGDWAKGEIFPDNIYHDEAFYPAIKSTLAIVSSFGVDSSFSETAGINVFGFEQLPTSIAFGKRSLHDYLHIPEDVYAYPCVLLPDIYILRDALDYTISLYNDRGILLFCQNFGDISSYMNPTSAPNNNFTEKSKRAMLYQYFELMDTLPEGDYTYMVSASTVGTDGNPKRREYFAFPVKVDNTKPQISDYYLQKTKDGKLYLYLEADDNNCLQGVRLSAFQYNNEHDISARFDLREDMLQYWGSQEALVDYQYDADANRYTFRYDLTRYKDFILEKVHEQNEVYTDGDVTIIFEKETDYSNVERHLLLTEAVDSAYNCSEEQVIDLTHYGEAVLRLVDEHNRPMKGVTVTFGGKIYDSDQKGCIFLKNLPLDKNKCHIVSDYVNTDTNSPYLVFYLSAGRYQGDYTYHLKPAPIKTPDDDVSVIPTDTKKGGKKAPDSKTRHEPTVIINFNTGENDRTLPVMAAVMVWITSVGCLTAVKKRKHRRR